MNNVKQNDFESSLSGKVSIITGAARGIGRAIAELFAERDSRLVLVDLLEDELSRFSEELVQGGTRALSLPYDVTDGGNAERIVRTTMEEFGAIDVLVNCAGIAELEPAEDLSEEAWEKTMSVNLKAPFLLSRAAGKEMIDADGGKIVNIASQAAVVGMERHAAYCASKAGLVGLTKVLAVEWGRYGIRVNSVSPTVVLTELGKEAWKGEKGEKMRGEIPAGRFAQPEEVAAGVAFLASDQADMINGENLVIDGGYTVH